jgi:hypothetical protein
MKFFSFNFPIFFYLGKKNIYVSEREKCKLSKHRTALFVFFWAQLVLPGPDTHFYVENPNKWECVKEH